VKTWAQSSVEPSPQVQVSKRRKSLSITYLHYSGAIPECQYMFHLHFEVGLDDAVFIYFAEKSIDFMWEFVRIWHLVDLNGIFGEVQGVIIHIAIRCFTYSFPIAFSKGTSFMIELPIFESDTFLNLRYNFKLHEPWVSVSWFYFFLFFIFYFFKTSEG